MTPRPSACEALKPSLVALVYEEAHPDTGRLLAHLGRCESCRRERADLLAVVGRIESALGPAAPGRAAFLEGLSTTVRPRSRALAAGWILAHALPACAVLIIALLLLLPEGPSAPKGTRAGEAEGTLFETPAVAAAGSYGGDELDRRLDWIRFELSRLEGDPW